MTIRDCGITIVPHYVMNSLKQTIKKCNRGGGGGAMLIKQNMKELFKT